MKRVISVFLALCFLLAPVASWASAVPLPWISQLDNDAAQMAAGKIYTYAAGTNTPRATWLDAAKTTTAANPLILDAYGRVTAYGDGVYKLIIKTADDVTITTIDNVELVSAVNPTTFSTTEATIASLTATAVDLRGGWIYNVELSNASMSNTKLSNSTIMEEPTTASNPVNLQFLADYVASFSTWINGRIDAHVASNTNPHGAKLYQGELVASSVSADFFAKEFDPGSSAYLRLTATGATLVGTQVETALSFVPYIFGAEQTQEFALTTSALSHVFSLYSGATQSIKFNSLFNEVDFGGATLLNFTGGGLDGTLETVDASATVATVYPDAGSSTIGLVVIPSSFTAGIYQVSWTLTTENNGDPASHFGSYQAQLAVSGASYENKYGSCGTNASSIAMFTQVGGTTLLSLSPGSQVLIVATQGTKVGNGVKSTSYAIRATRLGATKKAL
jgi:hypothetical protein